MGFERKIDRLEQALIAGEVRKKKEEVAKESAWKKKEADWKKDAKKKDLELNRIILVSQKEVAEFKQRAPCEDQTKAEGKMAEVNALLLESTQNQNKALQAKVDLLLASIVQYKTVEAKVLKLSLEVAEVFQKAAKQG